MPRDTGLWLLSAVACLSVLRGETYTRFDDGNSSVTLPNWRTTAEYVTKCDFNDNLTPLCGWTSEGLLRTPAGDGEYHLSLGDYEVSPSGFGWLESDLFNTSEESCLEFWYRVPAGHNSTDLRVLLRSGAGEMGETRLWSSPDTEDTDAWRQVFIPLRVSEEMDMQVVFEMARGLPEDGDVSIDKAGIRKGQCGEQCQDGSEFWTDDSTRCVCSGGQLSCSPATCPGGLTCVQSAPTSGPEPSGTCIAHSEPRYSTFDGVSFRFASPCTYILARTCDQGATSPTAFSVEAKNEQRGNASVSSVQQVNVDLRAVHVSMLRREFDRVMVNGMWRTLPLSLSGGATTIKRKGGAVVLETDFMLTVSYHASGEVRVTVPSQYSNKLCGMCGNFNHIKEDDFRLPDGSLAADAGALGLSWQSGSTRCEAPTLPSACQGQEELVYTGEPYCGTILAAAGPFAACSGALGADSFFTSCVLDMCTTHGDLDTLCDLLNTYANTCHQAGVTVPAWRNATFCPLTCAENSHYNACGSGCPEVCSSMDLDTGACREVCVERCECDPGFRLSAGMCVPAEDCGCWVDGEHYEKGVTFMKGQCNQLCQCMGQNNVQCSASSCSADEVCKVRDGVMGCERSGHVTCYVYGDPHYITFDGKAYSFQGNCNYTLAKTCGPTPVQFTVTTRNENWGRPTWSALNSVALEVDGLHIAVRADKSVYVNGAEVFLPVEPSTAIRVFRNGSYIYLDTTFGLTILFDGGHRLFVQVDERYKGAMCGLCGTFSGSQFDDFVTPNGELLGKPDPFGISWRVADSNWTCADTVPAKPLCSPELQEQGFQECRKLFGDTFMDCHMSVPPQIYVDSCMYDHCSSVGDQEKLCASLESYVVACEVNGVYLGDWRRDTVCATAIPTTTPPTTTTPASPASCPLDCNFDTDECGWEQLVQDSFDWTRRSGSTPTELTGPSSDHTTGGGSYMYMEGDSAVHGDSARMMSPTCLVPGPYCLRFWYHMYGMSTAMALNVYQLVGNRATKIWSKSNNQGEAWREAKVEIKVSEPFKILMEGIRGSSVMSDMALDDVSIKYGACGGSSSTGIDPTTLPTVTDSNEPLPVCDLACNFDTSLCSWDQLLTDSFDWTWQSGSTPTLMTGPSADHTSGSGHYLYIEGDGVYNGDTARILSGQCSDQGPQCLQFWYHMYGTADTMGLSVYLLEGRLAQGVWTKRNNQGDQWHKAEIDLMTTGPFQIILEGRRGTTELSDVAVDDISLYPGLCADLKPKPPVPTSSEHVSTSAAPPVNPEKPTSPPAPPPVNLETTLPPPVNPETPAPPPVNPETPAPPPVNPETPAPPPVNPETPAPPPVNPETPAPPPVNPETPAPPPVNPETPAPPPVNPETPAPPPVNPETPAPPPVNPETPAPPPVNPETPAPPPVNPETPAPPPVNPETPAPPPVNPETPAPPPVNPETSAPPPVNPETPAPPPIKPETPAPPPVNPETPAPPPVNPETPAPPPVNPETPAPPPVNPETPAPPPIKPETPAPPPVNPETPAPPPVNPETPAPPPVNPETPAPPPVNPETPAPPPVNPETPAPPPVNPETPAPPPVNPETPEPPPVNPETPAPPPVNPETPAPPPVNPETPAPPPVNPETPAPPPVKPTTLAPATPQPTPSCPKNSHYTDCMPACQPTCKHLHGPPRCDANEPCVEGCVCDDGFVLKDRACVPIRKCGCQDNKGQNHYFDEVWYTDHCEQRCECEEEDDEGHIECDDEECDGDDICYMDGEGEYTCKSTDFSECTIEEDPEYRTFDDMKHDFEGIHSYVLVQSTGLPKNLPEIYVEGINHIRNDQDEDSEEDHSDSRGRDSSEEEDGDKEHNGYPRELKIRVYNHTVVFKKNRKLYVDGVRSHPPVSPTTGLKVLQRSSRIYLKTDFGFSVEFNGVGKTEIILPHTYKRRVGGLCGNFDGRKKNDLMKPDGSQAKHVKEFGESWRVTEERLNIRWRRSARRGLPRP